MLDHLTKDYPSHDFVIDCNEAKGLFKKVREANSTEIKFEKGLREPFKSMCEGDPVRIPHATKLMMGPLRPDKKEPKGPNHENSENSINAQTDQPTTKATESSLDNDSIERHSILGTGNTGKTAKDRR